MANRLIHEKSPYLLQHAENPVDWHPWGEEAFEKARAEDKPVFLSIGYSTCHWCHVMEQESFEDEGIARLLNEHAVSIKVDREERPDVDQIYMTVCQALTGRGGWPLSIFMTPDRKPFFAGTYFPRDERMGMPGFRDVILQVADLWKHERGKVTGASERITAIIQPRKSAAKGEIPGAEVLDKARQHLRKTFDPTWGGFGPAPKFPSPHHLTFLLRQHARHPDSDALQMVEKTLDAMRNGGIFDQIGFGFHRYSVDERWLVPHFEKMLYDQALLAMAYCEAFQATGNPAHERVVREVFQYLLRDMKDPEGGFYSAEDADSEGKEGLFYVWTPEEVKTLLGEEKSGVFCRAFDISPPGNFEDRKSIARVLRPPAVMAHQFGMEEEKLREILEDGRKELFAAREKRVRPMKDDKVLTSWNGLAIAALAKGYQALGDPALLDAACASARFVLRTLRDDAGRLLRRYRQGEAAHKGYADDYAFLIWGTIELYEASFQAQWLSEAVRLQRQMLELFWDEEDGGFFYCGADGESLILRDRDVHDAATPSSNSVAALNLLRLSRMTGNTLWEEKADRLLRAFSGLVSDFPSAHAHFLNAVDFALGPVREIAIVGDPKAEGTRELIETVHRMFLPNRVLMLKGAAPDGVPEDLAPRLNALLPVDGKPTAYLCEGFTCREPLTDAAKLKAALTP